MPKYLSDEWMAAARALADEHLPVQPGVSVKLGLHVTGAPAGDVRYFIEVTDGRITDQALGARKDLDVELQVGYEDSVRIQKGELEMSVAFMQGKVKLTPGADMAKMMALLPLTVSADYSKLQQGLAAITEY